MSSSISRFFELFKNAHIVVKLVIIGLLLASVWSWAIILEKLFLFAKTRKETDKFEQVFWSGQSLEELYNGAERAPEQRHGRAVRGRDARMEALDRARGRRPRHGRCRASSSASRRSWT